jgi:TRAP-type C4-dicarboxylate transport system permease small subunit
MAWPPWVSRFPGDKRGGEAAGAAFWGDLMDSYIRVVAFLSRVAGVTAAFFIGFAVLVICDMVVERYLLNLTTVWQIDVVTYFVVAATFVGSAYVLMTRGHVNVDVLPLHVSPKTRYWLALVTILIGLAFVVLLFSVCTALWYQAWSKNWHSDTVWRAPLWVLQYVAELLCVVTGRVPPFGIREEETAEDIAAKQALEALREAQ